jgi:hypothetical protein
MVLTEGDQCHCSRFLVTEHYDLGVPLVNGRHWNEMRVLLVAAATKLSSAA